MAEYNLGLSQKLAKTAEIVAMDGLEDFDAMQTVTYLSLLSTEIALKALLEKAGQPIGRIKARSHNLKALLEDLVTCQVEVEIVPGQARWVSASRLRLVTIDSDYGRGTIGTLLEAKDVSTYPNQIRYGEAYRHYPPQMLMKMASEIVKWAKQYRDHIRLS